MLGGRESDGEWGSGGQDTPGQPRLWWYWNPKTMLGVMCSQRCGEKAGPQVCVWLMGEGGQRTLMGWGSTCCSKERDHT